MNLRRYLAGLCLALIASVAIGATLLPPGKSVFIDANGKPLSGGSVTFYIPGTSSFKQTWQDAGQTILNPNPVPLDASGGATVYGAGIYRQVVKDRLGNVVWDRLTSDTASSTSSFGGTSTGTANAQVVSAPNFTSINGQSITFVAGYTNTSTMSLNPSGTGAINVVNDTPTGSRSLSGGEIVAGNVVTVVYSATDGQLHTSIATSSIPVGVMQDYAGATAPTGFLLCDGSAVSRSTYANLYAIIGNLYGAGDGSTTFNLPDSRGRFIASADNMGGTAAGRLGLAGLGGTATRGAAGGAQTHTMTIAEMPAHNHGGSVSGTTDPTDPLDTSFTALSSGYGTTSGTVNVNYAGTTTSRSISHTHTFTATIASQGGGTAFTIVPPVLVVLKIIKY